MIFRLQTQSTKNNKFVISMQYFKKELSDEVHFRIQINMKARVPERVSLKCP